MLLPNLSSITRKSVKTFALGNFLMVPAPRRGSTSHNATISAPAAADPAISAEPLPPAPIPATAILLFAPKTRAGKKLKAKTEDPQAFKKSRRGRGLNEVTQGKYDPMRQVQDKRGHPLPLNWNYQGRSKLPGGSGSQSVSTIIPGIAFFMSATPFLVIAGHRNKLNFCNCFIPYRGITDFGAATFKG